MGITFDLPGCAQPAAICSSFIGFFKTLLDGGWHRGTSD
jgi:hypothetical protein